MNKSLGFKKVDNQELIKNLNTSLEMNSAAYDYVLNEIQRKEDILKYNENDILIQDELKNLKYIKFCLKFLSDSYSSNLEKILNG